MKGLSPADLKQYALVTTFRNPGYSGARRRELVIDPGSKSISGRDRKGPEFKFDGGYIRFADSPKVNKPIRVPLGELRTDSKGRLIVLGGQTRASWSYRHGCKTGSIHPPFRLLAERRAWRSGGGRVTPR